MHGAAPDEARAPDKAPDFHELCIMFLDELSVRNFFFFASIIHVIGSVKGRGEGSGVTTRFTSPFGYERRNHDRTRREQ